MKEYKISTSGSQEIRKKFLLIRIPIFIITVAIVFFTIQYNNKIDLNSDNVFLYTMFIMILFLGFRFIRSLYQQKSILESYSLIVEDDGTITRSQVDAPNIRIPKQDISTILKNYNGSFTINSTDNSTIQIPIQLDNFQELANRLNEIHVITENKSKQLFEKYLVLQTFFLIGVMAAFFISNDKYIVILSGIVMLALFVWSFIWIQKNENVDKKTKRTIYLAIPLLFFIVVKMYGVFIH